MKVNYVDELNTFMRYARSNALTGRERLLWIALFTIANERATYNAMTKEYDWPGGFFPVPNGELGLQSTLDKRGIETVRNSLKQRGLIDFQPGQKKKPPEYRMNYLSVGIGYKIVPNDVPNNVPNRVPNDAPNRVPNDVPNRVPNSAPLYIDINKIQVTDEDSDAEFFNHSHHHHHLRAGESGAGTEKECREWVQVFFQRLPEQTREQVRQATGEIFRSYGGRACTETDAVLAAPKLVGMNPDTGMMEVHPDNRALLEYGFKQAFKKGCAGNWLYVDGCLRNLEEQGVETADDLRARVRAEAMERR